MSSIKLLSNILRLNRYRITKNRTFNTGFRYFIQYKQNSQQTVSFDDIRLQKHLESLVDLYQKHEGKLNELSLHTGLSCEILNRILNLINEIDVLKSEIEELGVFISDLEKDKDELYPQAVSEKENLEKRLNELKNYLLESIIPSEVVDDKDIIIELSAGVGGQEAMLFAKDMFEMYCNYASWKGWNYEILKHDTTDIGGVRNAHIALSGSNAYKFLKFECGVHRVQRVPKTEKAGRIHTSTMTVAVLPQPSEIDIVIHPNDIELEFKQSSGAGGQHVNKTESCVRIYHKASGIVVENQMERSQHRNREMAMKSLRAKLYERELEAITKDTSSARKLQIGTAARSEKVRTYNFPQDRITDHRAHIHVYDVESFLRGEENFDSLSTMLQQWNNMQSLINILNKYDST